MPQYVTKEHFDATIGDVRAEIKSEVGTLRNDLLTKLDGMSVILQRLDQERIFTIEWVRRIESDVTRIKQHLKIA